jgi:class 3 adenylate cyclase
MANLPAGTVTFLFTDIEGSTRLLKQLGARYVDALAATSADPARVL